MKKVKIILIIGVLALTFSALGAKAFIGPPTGCSPGSTTCGGLFFVDSTRNIGFGTSSPKPAGTYTTSTAAHGYIFAVASTTNPGISLQNQTSKKTYIWSSRNYGSLTLYREDYNDIGSLPGLEIMEITQIGNVGISVFNPQYRLDVDGTVHATSFSGNGANLTALDPLNFTANSVFSSGSYAINGSFTVGTSTLTGIPTGGVFLTATSTYLAVKSGSVGIGTTNPTATLSVTGSSTISNALNVGSGKLYVSAAGNVGIGTASPSAQLEVNHATTADTVWRMGSFGYGSAVGNTFNRSINLSQIQDVSTADQYLFFNGDLGIDSTRATPTLTSTNIRGMGIQGSDNFMYVITSPQGTGQAITKLMTWDAANQRVGIATTTPVYGLDVVGTARFTQPIIVGTPTGNTHAATKLYVDSAITSGSATSSFTTITVTGTSTFVTGGSGTWSLGGLAAASINMNSYNISGVNKLTVTTVDPVYDIYGKKYATYGPSFSGGVKEEYVGKALLEKADKSLWTHILDFDKIEKGSDLWVWWKSVDFSKDNIDVFVSPYDSFANIYYKIGEDSIIFTGDKSAEFSYHLIGKRFDWKNWPTLLKDQSEKPNLIIK